VVQPQRAERRVVDGLVARNAHPLGRHMRAPLVKQVGELDAARL
jgi:hypothetical protein